MILGSTSTVIHNVKQRLLRNRPGSALRPLARKITKRIHSSKPASLNRPIAESEPDMQNSLHNQHFVSVSNLPAGDNKAPMMTMSLASDPEPDYELACLGKPVCWSVAC